MPLGLLVFFPGCFRGLGLLGLASLACIGVGCNGLARLFSATCWSWACPFGCLLCCWCWLFVGAVWLTSAGGGAAGLVRCAAVMGGGGFFLLAAAKTVVPVVPAAQVITKIPIVGSFAACQHTGVLVCMACPSACGRALAVSCRAFWFGVFLGFGLPSSPALASAWCFFML